MDIDEEKSRFNALTEEEAGRIADECEGAVASMRSCWHCNSAHEHLKEHDYIVCFVCGISYVRGYPLLVLGRRMRGEEITDDDMRQFSEALAAAE